MHVSSTSKPSSISVLENDFHIKLKATSKWKERSEKTLLEIHWPELNSRLGLDLKTASVPPSNQQSNDAFASRPDLTNKSKIDIVYLGNSMLERLKTTGTSTHLHYLAKEGTAWNAGCGGDTNENVIYRLGGDEHGMCHALKTFGNVKLWVIVSGTNNLRKKKPFRPSDVESYRLLLESCFRIAPTSKIVACDIFYRKDVPDSLVDESNKMLESTVQHVNNHSLDWEGAQKIQWAEARTVIGKDMLDDHVHLNEKGYAKWDEVLWPYVRDYVEIPKD